MERKILQGGNSNKITQTHPATAEPAGVESGTLGVNVGLAMTVPSTNGANPGRNLLKIEHRWN